MTRQHDPASPSSLSDCKLTHYWTGTAIDADTKLISSYYVGARDAYAAEAFIGDLASRLVNRVQLTSDGHNP